MSDLDWAFYTVAFFFFFLATFADAEPASLSGPAFSFSFLQWQQRLRWRSHANQPTEQHIALCQATPQSRLPNAICQVRLQCAALESACPCHTQHQVTLPKEPRTTFSSAQAAAWLEGLTLRRHAPHPRSVCQAEPQLRADVHRRVPENEVASQRQRRRRARARLRNAGDDKELRARRNDGARRQIQVEASCGRTHGARVANKHAHETRKTTRVQNHAEVRKQVPPARGLWARAAWCRDVRQ